MLDNQGQVKAFQILSTSGLVTPDSITHSRNAATLASTKSATIESLLLDGQEYPPDVSQYTSQLPVFVGQLNAASSSATALADALTPYTTPSDLLQMKIGWECHVKGNEINPAPPFALVDGMGDTITPQTLIDSVSLMSLEDLTEAMNAINAKMGAAGEGGAGEGEGGGITPPPPPAISEDEITALKEAVEAVTDAMGLIATASAAVSTLAAGVKTSTSQAEKGLENAVAITLTSSLKSDAVMLPAISLIMPPGVMDSLQEDAQ